ncbi:DUF445 family protein [Listeria monocytogenes]|nr:DUF445 family protein [Listeria monocytogenes]
MLKKALANTAFHHFGYENAEIRSMTWVEKPLEKEINHFLTTKKTTKMSDLIPTMLESELTTKLPHVTERITSKMTLFVSSEEGKIQIKQMLQKFFEEHGKMGSMARMFINIDSFSEKIQQEGLKLIGQEDTKNLINQLLTTEWKNFEAKELQELIPTEKQAHLAGQLTSELIQTFPHEKLFNQPIQVMLRGYEAAITEKVIPFAVERMLDFVATHSAEIVERMDLAKLVETQIATFSLPEIEKLVVEISGRELKMITYLGGILGGFIGIIQGVLAMWI